MFLAAITLAFHRLSRCREFTSPSTSAFSACLHLAVQDVIFYPTFNSPLYMTIRCKFSKTDLFWRGHTLLVFHPHPYLPCFSYEKLLVTQKVPLPCSPFMPWGWHPSHTLQICQDALLHLAEIGLPTNYLHRTQFSNWGSYHSSSNRPPRLPDQRTWAMVLCMLYLVHSYPTEVPISSNQLSMAQASNVW